MLKDCPSQRGLGTRPHPLLVPLTFIGVVILLFPGSALGLSDGRGSPTDLGSNPSRAIAAQIVQSPSVTWRNITASVAPPTGWGSVAFDAADNYFVYLVETGRPASLQTWIFSNGEWSRLSLVQEPPSPSGPLVYDESDGYVLLYSGIGQNGTLWFSQTWKFQSGVWSNITSQSRLTPSPRQSSALAYDGTLGAVVLYGGWCDGHCPAGSLYASEGLYNDTWEFRGGTWSQVPTSAGPPAMDGCSMAFDPSSNAIILYGGGYAWQKIITNGSTSVETGGSAISTGTWRFNGSWSNLSVTPPNLPYLSGGLVQDDSFGGDILFGGADQTRGGLFSSPTFSNATWGWSNSTWVNLSLAVAPTPRGGEALAYDPTDGYALLFGGEATNSSRPLNDTWTLHTSGFVALRPLSFIESGLGAAANWSVQLTGNGPGLTVEVSLIHSKWSYGGTSIRFEVTPGTYSYTAFAAGYRPSVGVAIVQATGAAPISIGFSTGRGGASLSLPFAVAWVGLGLTAVGLIGLVFIIYRGEVSKRGEGAALARRLRESDWTTDPDGQPVLWRSK